MSKEPETTKQLVIPGMKLGTVRAYQKLALQYDRPLAWVLRRTLEAALEVAEKAVRGGGGNRTRSSSGQLVAA